MEGAETGCIQGRKDPDDLGFRGRSECIGRSEADLERELYIKLNVSVVARLLLTSQKSTIRILEKLVLTDGFTYAGDQMLQRLACDPFYHDMIRRFSLMGSTRGEERNAIITALGEQQGAFNLA